MAKRIVDVLESVEIKQKDRCRSCAAKGSAQPLDQFLAEQGPVGQPRQRVVIGVMLQPHIFRLQLQRCGAQIVRQAAHALLRPVQQVVLTKQQYDQRDTAQDEATRQRGIDDVQLAHILMGRIDEIDIIGH